MVEFTEAIVNSVDSGLLILIMVALILPFRNHIVVIIQNSFVLVENELF